MITLVKLYTVAFASVGYRGSLACYLKNANYEKIRVRNSCTNSCNTTAITKWNKNWDYMEPETRVRPINPNKTGDESRYKKEMSESITATRNLILICQFQLDDATKQFTDTGKRQAELTGERLKNLEINWTEFVCHKSVKDIATHFVEKHLPEIILTYESGFFVGEPNLTLQSEPKSYAPQSERYKFRGSAQYEAIFISYFAREHPSQTQDTHYLIMFPYGVIKYLVLKALQLPIERWYLLTLYQGSITWISIPPNGHVQLRFLGDVEHIPKGDRTTKN